MTSENGVIPFFQSISESIQGVRDGSVSREELFNLLSSIESTVSKARKEVEVNANPYLEDEVAGLESAFALFGEGTLGVRKGVVELDDPCIDQSLEKIREAFVEMRGGLLRFSLKRMSENPGRNPAANLLMNAYSGLKNGACAPAVFQVFLDFFHSYLLDAGRGLRRLRRVAGELPEGFQARIELEESARSEAEKALADVREAFQRQNSQKLEEGLEKLRNFSEAYSEFGEEVVKSAAGVVERTCPRCGKKSGPGALACPSCKFPFPPLELASPEIDIREGVPAAMGFVLTPNIEKVLNAVEDFEDGMLDSAGFQAVLDWMEQKLKKGGQDYKSSGRQADEARKFPEIIKTYSSGVEEMLEGISRLRAWANSGLQDDVRDGVLQIIQGAAKLQEVVGRRPGPAQART